MALTTNTSILTAVGNDYGFDQIFARQVEALGRPGDVLLVISTSRQLGQLRARRWRRPGAGGLQVHGFLGGDGGRLLPPGGRGAGRAQRGDAPIQEIHITMGHLLCDAARGAAWMPATMPESGGRTCPRA